MARVHAVISFAVRILENVPLAPHTTLQVGGPARYFVEAQSEAEILDALSYAREHSHEVFVLGGGSNLVIADAGWRGLVLKIGIRGIHAEQHNGKRLFTAGAGEDWDKLVAYSVEQNCSGIECMSGIPGTVGGTPVQNVGAYGQEVAETIRSVRVIDTLAGEVQDLTAAECGFSYRTSIFNTSQKGRYIVTSVSYLLASDGVPRLDYADLKRHFAGKTSTPALSELRDAVRTIRSSKGMLISADDADSRSAGSFFKNPIILAGEYERIAALPICREQKPPSFPAPAGTVKISAAWLVEKSGFHKGYTEGRVGISHKHSLAIVNRGGATASEIVLLKSKVQEAVLRVFGVHLHPEPVFVGF
ncbi:MAG TPA: UDP-N-acetylmuramate dehydrogenase [Terriglobales bacterium]|nr:UDP-N-acetylmuramate dehydrogenase [Terriglobales bacterium]